MKFKDLVKETTSTVGTGAFVRAGAVTGFRAFTPTYNIGDKVFYCARLNVEWEIGEGTITTSGVERTRVIDSSNSGALVNFSAGAKELFATVPAEFLNGVSAAELPVASSVSDSDYFMLYRPGTGEMTVLATVAKAYFAGSATPADTTPPSLSSASATATGTTTATATVTTNEGAGTLYCLISTTSTATVEQVKAGMSQAVSSTGVKTFNATGLAASTSYYPHFVQVDAAATPNTTTVLTGASFVTQASAVAVTGVTLTGPASGTVSVQSADFIVGVTPVGGTIASAITVTPSDNGGGGTFAPTSVQITSAAPSATFKYTPSATAGAKSITVTNDAGLTNPTALTYTTSSASTKVYTITPYTAGNTIRTSLSRATDSAGSYVENGHWFINTKMMVTAASYWNISPNAVAGTDVRCGWSMSSTVPPAPCTAVQNNASAGASINGMVPMIDRTDPSWENQAFLWAKSNEPGPWFFHMQIGTEFQCLNASSGLMVTA